MFDRITAILVEKSQFINVCLDVYGTRAIQKFLEDISLLGVQSSFENQSNFDNILEAIKEPMAICQLVEHFNGSHVIQKIIKTFPNIDVIPEGRKNSKTPQCGLLKFSVQCAYIFASLPCFTIPPP